MRSKRMRAKELVQMIAKAEVTHALCDTQLAAELELARASCRMRSTPPNPSGHRLF